MTAVKPQPENASVQYFFFVVYYLANFILLFYLNISTQRLRSGKNKETKKIIYLFAFLIYYVMGKLVFKKIHTLISTASLLATMYLLNRLLQNLVIIGLTGGIACGKSTLVDLLKNNMKIKVIDCDMIAKNISMPGEKGYSFILKALGDKKGDYVDPINKLIIRDKLSELTFKDENFRKKLTNGLGKFIFWKIVKNLFSLIISGEKTILIDAPILYQTKVLEYICYPIIVVYIDEETQIKRLMDRNKYTREEALRRIRSQMPLQQKVRKGNICIKNNQAKETLLKNCLAGLSKFIDLKRGHQQ